MKRLITSAAAFVVLASAAHAQEPFKDVPRDHWAYDAVQTLAQRGLVIGYPDGTFGGKRAMTRYELAQVIARMIPQLERYIQDQVAASRTQGPDLSNYVTRDQLDALRKLVDEFGPELRLLRVDVDQLMRDVADLRGRVSALETEVGRVKFGGEATMIARMSSTERSSLARGVQPTDLDGRPINATSNLLEASQVFYDLDLNIMARVSKNITANALLNVGNYVGGFATAPAFYGARAPFNSNIFPYGGASNGSGNAEITPWKAYIEAPISLRPLGIIDVEAGKTGVQFTPYTLKLVDYDSYTNITKTDNGEVVFTGVKGKFRIGGVGVTAYAGTHGTALLQGGGSGGYGYGGGSGANLGMSDRGLPFASGFPVLFTGGGYNPTGPFAYATNGQLLETVPEVIFPDFPYFYAPATQSAGIHATLGTPFGGTLGLTAIEAGINNAYNVSGAIPGSDITAGSVYGADLALNLTRGIGFAGEIAKSDLFGRGRDRLFNRSGGSVYPNESVAWDTRLTFGISKLALSAGYKHIDPWFGAPGAWGAIGRWKNPTNIEGWTVTAGLPLAKSLALTGLAESFQSIEAGSAYAPGGPNVRDHSTKIEHYSAGLKFNLTSANRVDLGVETVYYKPGQYRNGPIATSQGRAQETYFNLGFGTDLSANASAKLLYQIVDYRDKDANLFFGGQDARGSVATAQFSVKF